MGMDEFTGWKMTGTSGDGAVWATLHEPSHIPGYVGPPEPVLVAAREWCDPWVASTK